MKKTSQAGFTLIELLVVISIIGLMSSIILTQTVSVRKKSRDTSRKQNLRQLQTAIELFYEDNGRYPTATGDVGSVWHASENNQCVDTECAGGPPSWLVYDPGNYIRGLVPKYVASLPSDPLSGGFANCGNWRVGYLYMSDGQSYKLIAHCATEDGYKPRDTFQDFVRDGNPTTCAGGTPDGTGSWALGVYGGPNGRCW